jgi:ferredoxin
MSPGSPASPGRPANTVLTVDERKCTGHGRCYTSSPELLPVDDEGFVATRGIDLISPVDRLEEARSAEAACPERAIAVREVDQGDDVRAKGEA